MASFVFGGLASVVARSSYQQLTVHVSTVSISGDDRQVNRLAMSPVTRTT